MKNKKSYFKRILSVMLVVCMMAAFIPAVSASTEETVTGVKVVYDFADYAVDTPLQAITYENSGGKIKFHKEHASENGTSSRTDTVKDFETEDGQTVRCGNIRLNDAGRYMAFKVHIPKGKKYEVVLNYVNQTVTDIGQGMKANMHLLPLTTSDSDTNIEKVTRKNQIVQVDGAVKTTDTNKARAVGTVTGTFTAEDEEYLLVLRRLSGGNGNSLDILSIELSEIDTETGAVYDNLEEVSFEPEVETVSQSVYRLTTVLGDEAASSSTLPVAVDIIGGYATVSADKYDTNGNTFLYWAKGLQTGVGAKVLSTNHEEYKFKPSNGANYIIAVYGKPAEEYTPKYFNANGQPLKNGGETVSMPGYGTTNKFKDCGFGVYIAEYDPADEETYTITVNNGTGPTEPVNFGDEVTVTATVPEENYFHFWQKKGEDGKTEVVSFEETYTFYAFEDCEVTAVYYTTAAQQSTAAEAFRKIILTNIGGNQFMTEFIGFEDAVEKGIAIGNNRIAMTTDLTQFTLDAEETEGVKGYAIDVNGNVYYAD